MLTRFLFRLPDTHLGRDVLDARPPPWVAGARWTLSIFLVTAAAWMCRPLLNKIPPARPSVRYREMARAGIWLNLIGIVLVTGPTEIALPIVVQ